LADSQAITYDHQVMWLVPLVIAIVAPFFARHVMANQQGARRWVLLTACAVVILPVPALLPASPALKFIMAMFAFMLVFRLADFAWARYPDDTIRTSWPHFLIPFVVAPDARWVPREERPAARKRGLKIVGRACLKFPCALALLALSTAYPVIHEHWWLQTFWALWLTYFAVTAIVDLLAIAPPYLLGVPVDEVFNAPPLASSPRDFWSRRWNLLFKTLCHRHFFVPLKGTQRPVLAVSVVFLFSALVHEYLVLVALGYTHGHMTVFFVGHGIATIVYGMLSKRRQRRPLMPQPLAVALHLAFFTATAWFFFTPFMVVFPAHTLHLW